VKILIIDFYYGTSNVGGLRWRKFAKYLPFETFILTSAEGNDVNIFSVPCVFRSNVANGSGFSDSLWGKIKRYARGNLFIPDPRRLWFAYRKAKKIIKQNNISLIITTGPPHSVHLLGLRLKKELNIKWIADFRDPWLPYYYDKLYLSGLAYWLQQMYKFRVLFNADYVIAVEEGIIEGSVIIPNCFDPEDFEGTYEPTNDLVYVGSLSDKYLLPEMSYKHIQGLSHRDACREMMWAGKLLVAYPVDVIPSKIYEYLASGRPILSFGIYGKGAKLIERCGAGRHYMLDPFVCVTDKSIQRNEDEIQKYNVKNVIKDLIDIIICNVKDAL
jgi:hypothetical protein